MRQPWLNVALGAALVVSLGLKTLVAVDSAQAAAPAPFAQLRAALQAQGFTLSPFQDGEDQLGARSAECQLQFTAVAPQGWHQSAQEEQAIGGTLAYFYRGAVYPRQPVLWTQLGHYWWVLTKAFAGPEPTVTAAIAGPGCTLDAPALQRLAVLVP